MLLDPSRATTNGAYHHGASADGYLLLTGATGLLGRYLLADLLTAGHRVAVVARGSKKLDCRQRLEAILQSWEDRNKRLLPRPIVLEGDVTRPGLGLSAESRRWIARHCNRMLHNAALLQFQRDAVTNEPWRTNHHGTIEALALARQSGISQLHYVSTAYVCGRRHDVVYEHQLEMGQQFRNDYEASKFDAELAVRNAAHHFDSLTVYRPAVIAGDSRTGYTSTYHGLFVYLRLMAMLVPHQQRDERGVIQTSIRLPMNGDEPRNIVPVDWVSQVITHLIQTPAAHGLTYHLSPEVGLTPRMLIEYCYKYFNSDGVEFCGPPRCLERSNPDREWISAENDFAAKIFENTAIYADYDTTDPTFDTTNLRRHAGHLPAPIIDREMIYRFLEFGQKDKWGRARPRPLIASAWGREVLDRIACEATSIWLSTASANGKANGSNAAVPLEFGLEILGPGGGQWRFWMEPRGFRHEPGLPGSSQQTVRVTGAEFADLAVQGGVNAANPWPRILKAWFGTGTQRVRTVA